jgi:hypothetical protein
MTRMHVVGTRETDRSLPWPAAGGVRAGAGDPVSWRALSDLSFSLACALPGAPHPPSSPRRTPLDLRFPTMPPGAQGAAATARSFTAGSCSSSVKLPKRHLIPAPAASERTKRCSAADARKASRRHEATVRRRANRTLSARSRCGQEAKQTRAHPSCGWPRARGARLAPEGLSHRVSSQREPFRRAQQWWIRSSS